MQEPEGLNRSELRAIVSVGFVGVEQLLCQDERRTLETIQKVHSAKTEQFASEHGGWVFRRETTGLWCSFPSVGQALRCIHGLLLYLHSASPLIRCGVHVGDVTLTPDGDCLGHTLSVAKRLETQALPEQLWISQESRERLDRSVLELFHWTDLGEVELKGVGVLGAHTAVVNRVNRSVFSSTELAPEEISGPGHILANALFCFQGQPIQVRRAWLRRLHQTFAATRIRHWSFSVVGVRASLHRLLEFSFEVSTSCRVAIFSSEGVHDGSERWGRVHHLAHQALLAGSEPMILLEERLQVTQNFRAEPYFTRPDSKLDRIHLKQGQTKVDLSAPPPAKPVMLGDGSEAEQAWANLPRDTTSTVRIQAVRLAPLVEEWSLVLPLKICHQAEVLQRWSTEGVDVASLQEWLVQGQDSCWVDLVLRMDSYGRAKNNSAWQRWSKILPVLQVWKDPIFALCKQRAVWNSSWRIQVDLSASNAEWTLIRIETQPDGSSVELPEQNFQASGGDLPSPWSSLLTIDPALQVPAFVQNESGRARTPFRPWSGYSLADDYLFYGRESNVKRLSESLASQPWIVLYGRSGVGKSSLLRAGLQSECAGGDDLWMTISHWGRPAAALLDALSQYSAETSLSSLARSVSQLVTRIRGRLVVVFDQMEELFRSTEVAERSRFVAGLYSLMSAIDDHWNQWGSRVRLIFCLQEESLAEFSSLESNLPGLLSSLHRLRPFVPDEAWDALAGPARLEGVAVENELLETLIEDLGRDAVCPTQLSICASRLWREFQEAQTHQSTEMAEMSLRRSHYWRLGGSGEILQSPVLETLESACLRAFPATADRTYQILALRDGASGVGRLRRESMQSLQAFFRGQGRASLRWDELTGMFPNSMAADLLFETGLVRLEKSRAADPWEARLALDAVAQEVSQWIEQQLLSAQYSQRLVGSELENWLNHRSLLSRERFFMIERQRQELQFTSDERRLMLRASACYGAPLDEWLENGDGDYLLSLCHERLAKSLPSHHAILRELVVALSLLSLNDTQIAGVLDVVSRAGTPDLLETLDMVSTYCEAESILNSSSYWKDLRARVRDRYFGRGAAVVVEAGPFWFGSDQANKIQRQASSPRYLREGIQSELELQQLELPTYLMDVVPVTNDLFAEFFPEHAERYPHEEGSFPVVSVSFYEAQAFARWLGKELPSEYEWEKAARGTEGFLYPWGDQFDSQRVNSRDSGTRRSSSVFDLLKGASPFGCLGMAGNVWEWTSSSYSGDGPFKVLKGGSCLDSWEILQCSSRRDGFPDFVFQQVGFRLKSSLQACQTAFEHLGRFGQGEQI